MGHHAVRALLCGILLLAGNPVLAQGGDSSEASPASTRGRLGNLSRAAEPAFPRDPDFNAALLKAAGYTAPVATGSWEVPVVTRGLTHTGNPASPALDFAVSPGDQVAAPMSGRIVKVGAQFGATALVINHGSGMFSLLRGPLDALVPEGIVVSAGQMIGQVARANSSSRDLMWSVVHVANADALTGESVSRDSVAQLWSKVESAGTPVDAVALLGMTLVSIELDPAPSGREFEIQLNDQTLGTVSATRPPIQLIAGPAVMRVVAREGRLFKTVQARDTATLAAGSRAHFTLGVLTAYQAQPSQVLIADQLIMRHETSTEVMQRATRQLAEASLSRPQTVAPAASAQPAQPAPPTTPDVAKAPEAVPASPIVTPLPGAPVVATPQQANPISVANPIAVAVAPQASSKPSDIAPLATNRKALVIGNDRYTAVTPLLNARADAQAIGRTLASMGYTVTVRLDLDERQMKASLREFRTSLEGGDEAVFFFAGHGVQLGAINYLLPVDIRGESEEQVRDDAMPLQRILDDLADRRVKLTLAIIDACRDNPFPRSGRAIAGRGRGLAPTQAATGQMVVYSAGAGQQALDRLGPGDSEPNSLFTRMLLREMAKPGVRVDTVIREVRKRVVEAAQSIGHEQVPAVYDQVVGDFYFVR